MAAGDGGRNAEGSCGVNLLFSPHLSILLRISFSFSSIINLYLPLIKYFFLTKKGHFFNFGFLINTFGINIITRTNSRRNNIFIVYYIYTHT